MSHRCPAREINLTGERARALRSSILSLDGERSDGFANASLRAMNVKITHHIFLAVSVIALYA
jgi:hypothetical protein